MTNTEIIFNNRLFLMEQGVLKGIPGTSITWKDEEDEEHSGMMPEQIHTFEEWKRMGFIVKKGEHAVAKFQIWMPKKGKKKAEAEEEEQGAKVPAGFYKKLAFFFTADQVKAIG